MNSDDLIKIFNTSKNLKVLFVEDDVESRQQTLKVLKNFFDNITVAINGAEGLNLFKQDTYDIIFTDIEMPVMNGIEMITKIRALDSNVSIIMLTAYEDFSLISKCVLIGIDGYLIKPSQLEDLLLIVNKIVNSIEHKSLGSIISLIDNFTWNTHKFELKHHNKIVKLTAHEAKFLQKLIETQGMAIGYVDIDLHVFDTSKEFDKKRIFNLLSRLRQKVGKDLIESIYGVGYRIKI